MNQPKNYSVIRYYTNDLFAHLAEDVMKAFHERTPKIFNLEMWDGFASFEVMVTTDNGRRPDEYHDFLDEARDWIEDNHLENLYTPQEVVDKKLMPLSICYTWEFDGEYDEQILTLSKFAYSNGIDYFAKCLKQEYLSTVRHMLELEIKDTYD